MVQAKRKAPDSIDAYDCVLRYYNYQIIIQEGRHAEVKACLEQAVVLDPDYAEAWAILSNFYMQEIRLGLVQQDAKRDVVAKAKAAVRRAINLDPPNPAGHTMLSNLLFSEGDLAGFRLEGEAALRLNPNNNTSFGHYGLRLALSGDWDRGLALLNKAFSLNPVYPRWYRFAHAIHHYDRGEYEQALAELEKIDMPKFFWTHVIGAAALGQLGRLEEAKVAVQELLGLRPAFRQQASGLIQVWQFPVPLQQSIVEGLGKAGLEISREASTQAN
jgi:tetratricopeptide (TPR) repeat protein